jgi:hypothetical protein
MTDNTDSLKMIIDLASERGVMQERSETLNAQNKQQNDENARLREELALLQEKQIEQELQLREKNNRIEELEGIVAGTASEIGQNSPALVVVNQYFTLSVPKTTEYVMRLDSEHRIFVGHLFQHTLPDNTPKHVLDQVREMTELSENKDDRLVDAMESIAGKDTVNLNFNSETNIRENYAPNVEHNGGLLNLTNDYKRNGIQYQE